MGAVEGARANAAAEGAGGECAFRKCDAKAMRGQLEDGSFDAIVTNVPWGVQVGAVFERRAFHRPANQLDGDRS
jgi:23S rRNA G2445 N2-methylase RlmL